MTACIDYISAFLYREIRFTVKGSTTYSGTPSFVGLHLARNAVRFDGEFFFVKGHGFKLGTTIETAMCSNNT
jgi:hypothetical protein